MGSYWRKCCFPGFETMHKVTQTNTRVLKQNDFALNFCRCIFTNINPETGIRNPNKEPFQTLVKTRTLIPGLTPVMGIQMGIRITGKVSIGDAVYIEDENEA